MNEPFTEFSDDDTKYNVSEDRIDHGRKTSKWLGWLLITAVVCLSSYGIAVGVEYVFKLFKH